MQPIRNFALTIAGFDPSSGAGLTADIKTFEQHKVYGLSVCSAITLQTENTFYDIRWEKIGDIIKAIDILLKQYPIASVKMGILPSLEYLNEIVSFIHTKSPSTKIIVDPILKSSSGFDFIKNSNRELFYSILKNCYLVTPNTKEIMEITGIKDIHRAAEEIAKCCNVFLKGGHNEENIGVDYLYMDNKIIQFQPKSIETASEKHGSGCILSAAIAANLTLGYSLEESCKLGKQYIERALTSNNSLLAYHVS
jgi:hydroxymethylpyrimidine/phosphomethylpyrimidine kinase